MRRATARSIIFGGGEVASYKGVEQIIFEDDFIICADSGYKHCEILGIKPNLLIGDFDSISEIPPDVPRANLPQDKNYSDMVFAIEAAIYKGCSEIIIIGALGGRFDHSFANIQSLVYLAENNISGFITDGATQIFCLNAESKKVGCRLSPIEDYYFSVFSYSTECKNVSIKGGKYSLDNQSLFGNTPRALSNEFIGEEVEISLSDGTMLIMIVPMD